MRIGFIGLGHMGSAMAKRLLEHGFELTVYNRTASKADPLLPLGARPVSSPQEAARNADFLITMLSDDQAVEEVLRGEKGCLGGLPSGSIHLSMSTISVDLARRMEAEHHKAGVRLVGAPVLGRPDAAASGQLYILAGGEPDAIRLSERIFSILSQKVFVVGTSAWCAHLMKILFNFMMVSSVEAMAEALAVARKSGLEAGMFLETMTQSIFTAPFYGKYGGMMVERRYEPAGFNMALGWKDMRLALAAAARVPAPLPLASLLESQALFALAHGLGHLDLAALGKVAEEEAGIFGY